MGREAKTEKDRVCRSCGETFNVTAKDLKRHARLCAESIETKARLDKLGLYGPSDLVIRRVPAEL